MDGLVDLQPGRLLVAAPRLDDPNFERTVVLLIDHGDEGAIGVVLNRPGVVPVKDILPAFDPVAASPTVVFGGGPVTPEGVLCVARAHDDTPEFMPVIEGVGVLGLGSEEPTIGVTQVRLFAGYAGWGPNQLEDEIAEGAWFVLDARASDPFSAQPEDMWAHVLRRAGGELALIATMPIDLRSN